jgi:hypothetical protein
MNNEATLVEFKPEETENKKPYTFRSLKSTDVFLMSKIISKIGINEFTQCFENEGIKQTIASFMDKGEDAKGAELASVVGLSVALEIANVILGNLPKCEKEIIQMLANVSGMTVKKVENLDAVLFFEMVVDFIKKEEFKDFIKVASKLFK